jgi:predicted TIM-barrel fold metal-dependent hydrolase
VSDAPLYDGPIVDAHHHVWEPKRNNYPWLTTSREVPHRYGDYSAIMGDYRPADYRRDAAGTKIGATVYVEAEWDPADPIGETRYVTAVAEKEGLPNAIVAQAWLHRENAAEVLAGQAEFDLVRSVRHKPEGPASPAEAAAGARTLMSDETWRRGYALLARHGLHFDLQTPWWNLTEAAELAADFPDTTLILNHAGVPGDREPETLRGWRAGMEALARNPNVVVKVSGIGMPGRAWTVADNEVIVTTIVELFGPERVMFGSNFPVDALCATFREIFDGFRAITRRWSEADQRTMYWNTALRIYRPRLPSPLLFERSV